MGKANASGTFETAKSEYILFEAYYFFLLFIQCDYTVLYSFRD